jgi:hypothetical protein
MPMILFTWWGRRAPQQKRDPLAIARFQMNRATITLQTLRALFARSGNRCSFPGCVNVLVEEDDLFVGQICHIEAAAPIGPRYNPSQTDDERRSGGNLILLCYPHHRRIDQAADFTAASLRAMRASHEARQGAGGYTVSDAVLSALAKDIDEFWGTVSVISRLEGPTRPFPMFVDPLSFEDLLEAIGGSHSYLSDLLEVARQGQVAEDWVGFHIGVPNHVMRLGVLLAQVRVRYYEQACLGRPDDPVMGEKHVRARAALHDLAATTSHVD